MDMTGFYVLTNVKQQGVVIPMKNSGVTDVHNLCVVTLKHNILK